MIKLEKNCHVCKWKKKKKKKKKITAFEGIEIVKEFWQQ